MPRRVDSAVAAAATAFQPSSKVYRAVVFPTHVPFGQVTEANHTVPSLYTRCLCAVNVTCQGIM